MRKGDKVTLTGFIETPDADDGRSTVMIIGSDGSLVRVHKSYIEVSRPLFEAGDIVSEKAATRRYCVIAVAEDDVWVRSVDGIPSGPFSFKAIDLELAPARVRFEVTEAGRPE